MVLHARRVWCASTLLTTVECVPRCPYQITAVASGGFYNRCRRHCLALQIERARVWRRRHYLRYTAQAQVVAGPGASSSVAAESSVTGCHCQVCPFCNIAEHDVPVSPPGNIRVYV